MRKKKVGKNRPIPKQDETISFTVSSIDLIPDSVSVNKEETLDFAKRTPVKFNLSSDVEVNNDTRKILITTHYQLYNENVTYFKMQVRTTFLISNKIDTSTNEDFLKYLVVMSVHHARGVQSMAAKDTPYIDYLIPLINENKIDKIEGETSDD